MPLAVHRRSDRPRLRRVACAIASLTIALGHLPAAAQGEPTTEATPVAEPVLDDETPGTPPARPALWHRFTGFGAVGSRLRDEGPIAVLLSAGFAVEEQGPATRRAGAQSTALVTQRRYMATRGALAIASGRVTDYDVETSLLGMRITEEQGGQPANVGQLDMLPVHLWREPSLDRDWGVDVSMFRGEATLILPQRVTTRTVARLAFQAPGYRHVAFASDDRVFNGARLSALSVGVGQQFGPFGAFTLEPSASARADVAVGAVRKKRFATDSMFETAAGLRLGFGRSVAVVTEVAYRANVNSVRTPNPSDWRLDSGLVIVW